MMYLSTDIKSVMTCINTSINRYVIKAAKALVISEPIAIFHPRDGKSSLVN